MGVLGMAVNFIWLWGTISVDQESVEGNLISIISSYTLSRNGITF